MPSLPVHLRRVLIAAAVIVLVLMVADFNHRLESLNSLNKQAAIRQAQATQAVQTRSALETQVAFAGSTEAVNDWARTEGHYIQDGDQAVVPVGQPGSPPIVTEAPAPTPTTPANWQVWWNLFFSE